MINQVQENFNESIQVKQAVLERHQNTIADVAQKIIDAMSNQKKVMFCGNGGSAADSQHIAAEFIGRFQKERQALPAIALTTDTSILTALGNDYGYDTVFARQVSGLGQAGDILVGISTSGNSGNILKAFEEAKAKSILTVAFTGDGGGKMGELADILIDVPSKKTSRIQESHICIAHTICEIVEDYFYNR